VKLTEAKTPTAKLEVWKGLLGRKHLGALALLRNLRNMQKVGVEDTLIKEALGQMKVDRVLPFRFLTAARYAPGLEPELEAAMFRCLADQEGLSGQTVVIVDVSGSMYSVISTKSEVTRMDAACGIAILVRELCTDVGIVAFSNDALVIPPRRGMALRDAIVGSMPHGSTMTGDALALASRGFPRAERVILITDEQSHQVISKPWGTARGYVVNVASAKNGIGYGSWVHIDGWSEAVVDYIRESERTKED
jgi:Mg-chelatase subunit ChlD